MRPSIVAIVIILAMLEQSADAVIAPCDGKIDLQFIIYTSISVGPENFEKEKIFVSNISNYFVMGADKIQIGLATYRYGGIEISLNQTTTHQDFQQAVMNVPYAGRSTHTSSALITAHWRGFNNSFGARTGSAKQVVVLLVADRSNQPEYTLRFASLLKKENVIINVVGIGPEVDEQEIRNVSSGEKYTFFADSLEDLDELQNDIVSNVCEDIPSCDGQIDLMFIIHAFPYFGADNYEVLKTFVADISNNFVVGPNNTLVSLIFFSVTANFGFYFNETNTNQGVQQAVMNVPYEVVFRDIDRGLTMAVTMMTSDRYGHRLDADKVVVILVAGKSDGIQPPFWQTVYLKMNNVTTNVVGVGPTVDQQEIRSISSGESHTFFTDSFDDLDTLQEAIVSSVCEGHDD